MTQWNTLIHGDDGNGIGQCQAATSSEIAIEQRLSMANLHPGHRQPRSTAIPPTNITTFPTEIQTLFLRHLDWQSLLHLRATNRYYRHIISSHDCCHNLWKTHHDNRWPNGKRRSTRCSSRIETWSRQKHWKTHPAEILEGNQWFVEFLRRYHLDQSVLPRLMELDVEQQSQLSNNNHQEWYSLMADGEDIVDCLKRIISLHKHLETSSSLVAAGEKVLNGICRCVAYQEWKFLHDPTVLPQAHVEDGAIAIAKFYEKHDMVMKEKCIHSWEDCVLRDLENLAGIVRKRLEKRSCILVDSQYPIRDVIEEMKCLFCAPDPEDVGSSTQSNEGYFELCKHYFRGNINDYYNHHNSLINHCLKTRTGIPITLAVIYAAIVRRACGVRMDIIGLPGHIVVGVPSNGHDNTSRIFIDPFHQGKILSFADCESIVARYNMAFHSDMLRPISNEEVWQRMIRNLIHSHSMQALADDNENAANADSEHEWKIAIPLRFLLSDYAPRINSFRELVSAPGWCPQFF
mmetsp:Transcript_13541/g.23051  ORF Transcript_13541/g.23051 Transcript_13541/m.23051 type:complete len:517 (-) Transcript_13541:475-2025(-)